MKHSLWAIIILGLSASTRAEFRTWTSSDGEHQILAEFVKLENGQVTLRRENSSLLLLPLNSLSLRNRLDIVGVDPSDLAKDEASLTGRITLRLPKAMFIGTPVPPTLPNYELPDPNKIVTSFKALPGTVNVAKGCKVTSSDTNPIFGEISCVTNGDADSADGSYVELMAGQQWIQIDLTDSHVIQKIAVWHYHKQAHVYLDVVVQVCDDPEFKENVLTVFNNDDDNTSGLGKGIDPTYLETCHGRIIEGKGVKARYVRLWSNGNTKSDFNHYCEVQVFAVPAK